MDIIDYTELICPEKEPMDKEQLDELMEKFTKLREKYNIHVNLGTVFDILSIE